MYHILRSEEFMACTITRSESSSKWQDARDFQLAVQKTCQVSDVEKLFPEQFETVNFCYWSPSKLTNGIGEVACVYIAYV